MVLLPAMKQVPSRKTQMPPRPPAAWCATAEFLVARDAAIVPCSIAQLGQIFGAGAPVAF
eukprot:6709857-Lingulodinium_polyedra.AAC.1